jgi:hypothetical protein
MTPYFTGSIQARLDGLTVGFEVGDACGGEPQVMLRGRAGCIIAVALSQVDGLCDALQRVAAVGRIVEGEGENT